MVNHNEVMTEKPELSAHVAEAITRYAEAHGVPAATLVDAIVLEWLAENNKD